MKSHFSHMSKRNGNCCPYRRKHLHYFLKDLRRRCPLAPSSSSLARLGSALALALALDLDLDLDLNLDLANDVID